MDESDLNAVHALSQRVHPRYPERADVLAEKLRLFAGGCFVLAMQDGGDVVGYCFSHPWDDGDPPSLDTFLHVLPARQRVYFIHDLTLDEAMRGLGLGRALVPVLIETAHALGLPRILLVAVEGRAPFWAAAGFAAVSDRATQVAARAKYGDGALAMARQLGST